MTTSILQVRIDEQLKKSFIEAAQSNDRDASQLIRDFVRSYLEKNKQQDLFDKPKQRKTK